MSRHDFSFSKMEIKNFQTEVNIFEDTDDMRSNTKILMLLDNIILDDTRHKSGKKAIRFFVIFYIQFIYDHILIILPSRLIEKYFPEKKASPASMLSMLFESKLVKQERESDENENQIWVPEKYSKPVK